MANANENSGVFRLDAVSLDATAQILDPEMRERFLWLGSFLREECNRDLNLLTDAFKAQGVDHDRTTWSKIFRGRWKRNAQGEELPSPILSVTSFNDAVDALREQRRVEEMRGKVGFIKTSTWDSFKRYVDIKRAPDRVNKFGVIVGPTGSQKTACRKEYVRLNNHCQVVGVEAPERFSMYQFLTDLVEAYRWLNEAQLHPQASLRARVRAQRPHDHHREHPAPGGGKGFPSVAIQFHSETAG